MKIKIGTDPEIFLLNEKSKKYVSAYGLFPGTKDKPHKVDKGAVQVDGMALEFNINPAETDTEFVKNVTTVYAQLEEMVKKVDKDLSLSIDPVATFDKADWDKIHENAKELGCDPDYNHRGEVNPNPVSKLKGEPFRTAAGHIHIGFTEGQELDDPIHFADCKQISQYFYQNAGTVRDPFFKLYYGSSKEEKERLKYYGHSGSFRPKSYGIELRSPSNRWLVSKESIRGAFNLTKQKFETMMAV